MAAPTNTPSMDLCTSEFFETWANYEDDPAAPLVSNAITRASKWIEVYCGREFKYKARSAQLYDGNGESVLFLREFPVDSVASVGFETDGAGTYSTETLTYLDVNDTYNNGEIIFKDGTIFPRGRNNVQITHTSGLASLPQSLPLDLQGACAEMVQGLLRRRDTDAHLVDAVQNLDGGSINFRPEDIPKSVMRVLANYRVQMFGAPA